MPRCKAGSLPEVAPHDPVQPHTSTLAAAATAQLVVQHHMVRCLVYLSAAVLGATPAGLEGLHVNLWAGLEISSSRFHQPPPSARNKAALSVRRLGRGLVRLGCSCLAFRSADSPTA